jgi:hypothetical protein
MLLQLLLFEPKSALINGNNLLNQLMKENLLIAKKIHSINGAIDLQLSQLRN